jgi:hypothetical protein
MRDLSPSYILFIIAGVYWVVALRGAGECSDWLEEQVVTGSYVIACEVFEEMVGDEELWPGMVLITRIFKR